MVTSSIGSKIDFPFLSAYVASKAALEKFYRDVALQLDNVKVVIVCPGPVVSELGKKAIGSEFRSSVDEGKKMSTARCCELTIIAMANGLNESWVANQPHLFGTYLADTFYYQMHYLFKLFGLKKYAEKMFVKSQ